MNKVKKSVVSKGTPKQVEKKVTKLPPELRDLVVDTKNYKDQTSSTEILKKLRYQSQY